MRPNISLFLLALVGSSNINVSAFCSQVGIPKYAFERTTLRSDLSLAKKNKGKAKKKRPLGGVKAQAKTDAGINAQAKKDAVIFSPPAPIPKKATGNFNVPVEPAPKKEKNFEDDILEDITTSLIFLENRVKNGPGSFSMEQMIQFEASTARIVKNMNAKYQSVPPPPSLHSNLKELAIQEKIAHDEKYKQEKLLLDLKYQNTEPVAVSSVPPPPPPTMPSMLQYAKKEMQQQQQEVRQTKEEELVDIDNSEGPAYDGEGGLGLAAGTRNTYIIPGMDEMTGEEYRAALQATVSARQEKRRDDQRGMIGNRAAHSYLDQLGYGGAASNLSGRELVDDDTE